MNDRIPGSCWDNPIWYMGYRIFVSDNCVINYQYVHDSYDGPEDNRCEYGKTVEECKTEIDEREE